MKHRYYGRKFIFIIPIVLLAVAVFSGAVMLLWNNVLALVISVHTVNFWQALGLLVLSKILFGGFRGGQWGRQHWRNKMMQRWETMTPEEKERFRGEWERRCGRRFAKPFDQESPQSAGAQQGQ